MTHHPDPRVEEVLSRFDIQVDEYTPESLVKALRGSWNPPPDGRFLDVLIRPAFGPELLLVLHERSDGTVLWASTAQVNLFHWQPNPLHPAHNPDERPALVTATVWPDSQTTDHLWALAGAVSQPDPHPGIGLDGVSVDLRIRLTGSLLPVHVWYPPHDSPVGTLLEGLGQLVRDMPVPFPAIMSAAGVVEVGDAASNLKEYVGLVWIGDDPGKRVSLLASSGQEAREKLRQEYGEATVSVWNEDDAKRLRR